MDFRLKFSALIWVNKFGFKTSEVTFLAYYRNKSTAQS